ncbi:MAG: sirohydrochlorin cobaltochelatase [Lachnospiraceae bacterium]|nr:sirohydrochlorin cobaltochelatase [Lachnospiraceae bacterium]
MWKSDKKGALLVVSFGTSYRETREKTIDAIEKALSERYPEYEIRRVFTSKKIIRILKERDGIYVDQVEDMLEKLWSEGCPEVILQPTYMTWGKEYEFLLQVVKTYEKHFTRCRVGAPVLSELQDYRQLADILLKETRECRDSRVAVVFMGHGTEETDNEAYRQMDAELKQRGYNNVYVGTFKGQPDFEAILEKIREQKDKVHQIILYPLMIAAGRHAVLDMSGDSETSWKMLAEKAGYQTTCRIKGLGEYPGVWALIGEHVEAAKGK